MNIAILSNVTVSVLARDVARTHAVWTPSGFGAWAETAFAPPDGLRAFAPSLIVLVLDRRHGAVDESLVVRVRTALREAFPGVPAVELDPEELAADEPEPFYDEKMWQYAAMPFSLVGLAALAREIDRLAAARTAAAPRKALALDLDGTLWDGVVGEDGPAGIVPRTAFQHALKALRDDGVVLTVLSRNTEADVAPVWDDPRMVLKPEDFAAWRIDWREKAENLAALAAQLNVHPDAFVFVDDNPAERARMCAAQPEVAVPAFAPGDGPRFVRRLRRLYFPFVGLTAEDRAKTDAYRADDARRALAATRSLADYLAELALEADIASATAADVPRLAQLSQKANQFNVCTNRYGPDEIRARLADPRTVWLTVRARDRFGEQGLVAFLVAYGSETDADTAELTDFVMSCRAMNRRLEHAAFNALVRRLRAKGVVRLQATYRPTPRNVPVADLFPRLGLAEQARTDACVRYVLDLARYADAPHAYAVTEKE